jgi:hypothetical protein
MNVAEQMHVSLAGFIKFETHAILDYLNAKLGMMLNYMLMRLHTGMFVEELPAVLPTFMLTGFALNGDMVLN